MTYWVCHLTIQFPFSGEMAFRLKSLWSLYTLLSFGLQSVLAWQDFVSLVTSLEASVGKIEDLLLIFNAIIYLAFHFVTPVICCAEWTPLAKYFNSWKKFEVSWTSKTCFRVKIPTNIWCGKSTKLGVSAWAKMFIQNKIKCTHFRT